MSLEIHNSSPKNVHYVFLLTKKDTIKHLLFTDADDSLFPIIV